MLNIEYWKDELKKIGEGGCIVAVENNIPKPCDEVSCLDCDFYLKGKQVDAPARCERFYDWLLEEHKEPEIDWDNDIDWMRVPEDTEVLIANKPYANWKQRKFAIYVPNAKFPYYVFESYKEKNPGREHAEYLLAVSEIKLRNERDIEKYRKVNYGK